MLGHALTGATWHPAQVNLGFYPPASLFYQFLLFAVFDAVRLVPERWPSRAPAINSPSQCVGKSRITSHNIHRAFNQTLHPTIWTANWSSWTSKFEPPRINSLQSSNRNLIDASEGLV